jgi:hypothetical protein
MAYLVPFIEKLANTLTERNHVEQFSQEEYDMIFYWFYFDTNLKNRIGGDVYSFN